MAVGVYLSPSTHSLENNSIGNEGAKVLSDAIKTMANLKELHGGRCLPLSFHSQPREQLHRQ